MLCAIDALRYRCLRNVSQPLEPFHILVGPNGSGKSTFLDVPALLGDLLRRGLDALGDRSPVFQNLLWMERGETFEVAVEFTIPTDRRQRLRDRFERARYEVSIGCEAGGELSIRGETLWLKKHEASRLRQLELFPNPPVAPEHIVVPDGRHAPTGWKKVVTKKPESGNDYFLSETTGWNSPFRLGPRRLALANLPEDEDRFPVATWVKRVLMEGVQRLALNSIAMRAPSPPGSPREFQSDGANLPWVLDAFQRASPDRFEDWLSHVRTALPDVLRVDTVEREEDRHRYLRVAYRTGHRAPGWTVSDGTLRLLALTLVAYLDGPDRIYLIEEPENGVHPQALECVFQALSSAYSAQILCATHSPLLLSLVDPRQLLCFSRTEDGVTDIVPGNAHPRLVQWKREADLGTLFAAGVLG